MVHSEAFASLTKTNKLENRETKNVWRYDSDCNSFLKHFSSKTDHLTDMMRLLGHNKLRLIDLTEDSYWGAK